MGRRKYNAFVPPNPPPGYTSPASKEVSPPPTPQQTVTNVYCPDLTCPDVTCPDVTIIQSGSQTTVLDPNDQQYDGLVVITDPDGNDLIQFKLPQDYMETLAQTKQDILALTQIADESGNVYKLKVVNGNLEIVKIDENGDEQPADFWT